VIKKKLDGNAANGKRIDRNCEGKLGTEVITENGFQGCFKTKLPSKAFVKCLRVVINEMVKCVVFILFS
jgi:hypothetical protein